MQSPTYDARGRAHRRKASIISANRGEEFCDVTPINGKNFLRGSILTAIFGLVSPIKWALLPLAKDVTDNLASGADGFESR